VPQQMSNFPLHLLNELILVILVHPQQPVDCLLPNEKLVAPA
jgi:hypothetical protein